MLATLNSRQGRQQPHGCVYVYVRTHSQHLIMQGSSKKVSFILNVPDTEVKQENNHHALGNKKARIIVRNLPFKNLSDDKMREWFGKYGTIEEVKLLKNKDGRFVGCGFVQFSEVASAAKAIQKGNQKEISGRKVIMDWAVPKKVYDSTIKNSVVKKEEGDDDEGDFEGSTCGELPYWIDRKPTSENEGEDSEGDSDEEHDSKENVKYDFKKNKQENGLEKKVKVKSNDVEQGQTIFVRNLPFSTTNEDLTKCFSSYGVLEYALVCIDKLTEHSKGTGFVKFKEKACAQHCLTQSNKIFIEDTPLLLSLALSKDQLDNKKQKKVVKDSRNLYLSKEGVIMAGSAAAYGVSAADMAKRLEIEQYKSQMLKNLNMFVSDKRLIVYNLPATFDDGQLKALFLKHTHPKAVITESRVMRDKKKFDAKTGLGISKEYGFVTFKTHEDALLALRNINNNPKIFSVKNRPIVSFSIESKTVLNIKKKRLEKSRIKLDINEDSKLMKLNKKQRRFIRRKQKIIEKRREKKKLSKGSSQEEEKPKKRKIEDDGKVNVVSKKQKVAKNKIEIANATGEFCGIVSEPGAKVKLRSRYKLRNQARIHKQHLKEEKLERLKNKKRKLENYKQPKQKQSKKMVKEDSRVGKLITKHKKALESAGSYKKWDE